MSYVRIHDIPNHVKSGWQKRAACRGAITVGAIEDHTVFPFPKENSPSTRSFINEFCGRCPVRGDCLRFAIDMGYTGVWGGRDLTDADIRDYRKAMQRNALAEANA
jgi:WhiB family redox-sensing transcriptional regulator